MFDFTSALLWSIAARKLPALLALSSDVNPLTWNTVLTCFHLLYWVCASKDKCSFGGIFISGNRWAWSFLMQYWKNLTVLWFFAKPYKIIRVNDHYHVGFIMFCKSSKDENMDASLFDFKTSSSTSGFNFKQIIQLQFWNHFTSWCQLETSLSLQLWDFLNEQSEDDEHENASKWRPARSMVAI